MSLLVRLGDAGGMQNMIMQLLMSDPELAAGLQKPKIIKAFTSMMGGGGDIRYKQYAVWC